jgi:MauM/NapG family ferredoxin protein
MKGVTRRSFLGLQRADPEVPPVRDARSEPGRALGERGVDGAPLPAVIAWLADSMEPTGEPPLPPRARHLPILRPPGAVSEADFLRRCTRCERCAQACPHGAIAPAPPVFGAAAATPWIDPSATPCRLCDDLPCIAACPTGALQPDGDRMGTAWIQTLDCLNGLGSTCRVCREQCPVDGAIEFVGGMPRIHAELCVGCGVCHHACPAPSNAIAILPNAARRTPVPPLEES